MSATTSSFREAYLKARYRFSLSQVVAELLQKRWMDALVPFVVMVVVLVTFTQLIAGYTSADNLINTAREFGEFGFLVLALTLVVIAGGIDLSIGAIFAISDLVALITFVYLGWPLAVVIPVTLLSGGLLAAFNGALIGFLRTRAFLTTLVTMIIFRAVFDIVGQKYASQLMAGAPSNDTWEWLGSGSVLGVPSNMFVLILVAIAGHIFLSRSRPGWHLTAIGAGRRAARHAGINIESSLFWTYVGSGVLCSIGGLFYAARLASAGSDTGLNSEIVAITAVVLGGVSLGGGKGSVGRAMIGATTVLVLTNGVVRLGVVGGMSSVVLGATLLLAVAIDVHWAKHRHKAIARLYVVPTYVSLPKGQSTDEGPFKPNQRLAKSEAIGLDMVDGPEDVIIDRQGRLYAGVRQGWILRFSGPNFEKREVWSRPGGRPLGMAFDKDDNLIVCVAGMGLYGCREDGSTFKLSDETNRSWNKINDDSRLRLADDLDIGPDGRIYFSEATIRYDIHSWATDALEGRGNGRIIEYDPRNKKTRTIIKNVMFPNGICMSHDGKSFLFASTWGHAVFRYWTEGPKAGTVEPLITDLPGFADNINRSSDGKYWLALVGMRTPTLDLAMKHPGFRTRMVKEIAPDEWLFPNINNGCVCKFDDDGKVSESLWDSGGDSHPTITSMREDRGHLYIGGLYNNRIGRIPLEGSDASWNGVESYWGKK
jgi:ribose transport system permease protein